MKCINTLLLLVVSALLASCASNPFVSTWHAPDAESITVPGSKVVAIAMIKSPGTRRAAEEAVVSELNARGAEGIPLYAFMPEAKVGDEAKVQARLKAEGIQAVIVVRPVGAKTEVKTTPGTYSTPRYSRFYGGYYGYGMHSSWGTAPEVRTDTIVYVETLVYSLEQNKLIWAGQSKSTNPSNINRLVKDTAKKVSKELQRLGLVVN